jgi:ABC-type transport system involved in multi-copper enzyme maturation permease subunit
LGVLLSIGGYLLMQSAGLLALERQLLGWALLVVCLFLVLAKPLLALLGPLTLVELARLARRSHVTLLRTGYLLLLLIVLFGVYVRWFGGGVLAGLLGILEEQPLPHSQQARFAASFFHSFLVFQFAVLLLVTPALMGGVIAGEREKGTLGSLMTTALSDREIVCGKLFSRLAYLLLLLMAGMPILGLLQLMGGVDITLFIAGFSVTALTALSAAAACLYCSASAARTREAILRSYLLVFVLQLSPMFCTFSTLSLGTQAVSGSLAKLLPELLVTASLFHGLLTIGFVTAAVGKLRSVPSRQAAPNGVKLVRWLRPRFLQDSPLLWKEVYVEQGIYGLRRNRWQFAVLVGICLVVGCFLATLPASAEIPEASGTGKRESLVRLVVLMVAGFMLLGMTVRAAGTIAGERERHTFESLLATDLNNAEILQSKWLGCLAHVATTGILLLFLLYTALAIGEISLLGFPLLLFGFAVEATMVINLGMYCSLLCRSTFRATLIALLLLLVIVGGHWLLYLAASTVLKTTGHTDLIDDLAAFHEYGLTTLRNLEALATIGKIDPHQGSALSTWTHLAAPLMGILIHAILAGLFGWRLRSRFGPITGRIG